MLGGRRPNEIALHKKPKIRWGNDPQSTARTSMNRSCQTMRVQGKKVCKSVHMYVCTI